MDQAVEPKEPFLTALGERTRKGLAQAAQVSERHVANIEMGVGNASVQFLRQLAQAPSCSLAELVGDETSGSPECEKPPFVELNRNIKALAGCTLPEIHSLYGPAAYRRYEKHALEEAIARHPRAVIATPGGIVPDPATFNLLLAH